MERSRPAYDAAGILVGALLMYPKLNVSTQYNDNIYAASSGAISDIIFRVQPSISLATLWPNDRVELTTYGGINRYADRGTENSSTYGATLDASFSAHDSTSIRGNFDFHHDALPRESILSTPNTQHPVEYNQGTAHVEVSQRLGNLQFTGFGDWLRLAYQNNLTPLGDVVFEKDLNYQTTSGGLRSDYAISPDTSLFISGKLFSADYAVKPPFVPLDRSSNGYEITGGLSLHMTDILTGDIGAGYLSSDYPHIGGQNVNTLAVHLALAWYPTLLTTVKFQVDRSIEEAPIEISSGNLATQYRIEIDHELRRNLILSLGAYRSTNNFSGVDRHDEVWNASAGATCLVNNSMSLKLSYAYQSRDSVGSDRGPSFGSNTIMLSFVLQR